MMEQQSSMLSEPDPQAADPWRSEVQARLQRYKSRRGRTVEGAYSMRFPFPPLEINTVPDSVTPVFEPDSMDDGEPEYPMPAAVDAQVAASPAPAVPDESLHAFGGEAQVPSILAPVVEPEPEIHPEAASQVEELPAVHLPTPMLPAREMSNADQEETTPVLPAALPPRPRPRRKVIAFPQPAHVAAAQQDRLAEPVTPEQLRILDVPEELEAISATPFLDGLLDAVPAKNSRAAAAELLELPFPLAKAWARVQAGLLDTALLGVGFAIFTAAAYRFLPQPIPGKYAAISAGAACVLLWVLYQYLFTVYGGRTLGMKALGIQFRTFKGATLGLRKRRARVLSFYLSALSMGMGILWYLVDVDSLCWHDRITQTFPTQAK